MLGIVVPAGAEEPDKKTTEHDIAAPENWRVVLEPAFMDPEISDPIQDSEKTVLAAALWDSKLEEIVVLRQLEFLALDATPKQFFRQSLKNIEGLLADDEQTVIEVFRDDDEIIEYAAIGSTNPALSGIIFTAQFFDKFSPLFGPGFLCVIPDRTTIFAFPRVVTTIDQFAGVLTERYGMATYPVSTEIFEVNKGNVRVIGDLAAEEDDLMSLLEQVFSSSGNSAPDSD